MIDVGSKDVNRGDRSVSSTFKEEIGSLRDEDEDEEDSCEVNDSSKNSIKRKCKAADNSIVSNSTIYDMAMICKMAVIQLSKSQREE